MVGRFSDLFVRVVCSPPVYHGPGVAVYDYRGLDGVVHCRAFKILTVVPVTGGDIVCVIVHVRANPLHTCPGSEVLEVVRRAVRFVTYCALPYRVFVLRVDGRANAVRFIRPFLHNGPRGTLFILDGTRRVVVKWSLLCTGLLGDVELYR